MKTQKHTPTPAQIKHLVDRFLSWKLPEDFNPDGGISFKAAFNEHTAYPMRHEPVGTNLLTAAQAEAMVRHMIDGMPVDPAHADLVAALIEARICIINYADPEERDRVARFLPKIEAALAKAGKP